MAVTSVKDQFGRIISSLSVDHADLRFEENRKVSLLVRGRTVEEVADYATFGGHVRAWAGGGKALASFTDPQAAASIASSVASAARSAGRRRNDPLPLADAPAVVGSFRVQPASDPRAISLQEKLDLLQHYNDLILREPTVITTEGRYDEFYSARTLANRDGTLIDYELLNVTLYGFIVTKRDHVVQRVRFAFGGCDDYSRLLNREEELRALIETARALPGAEPAPAGTFPVLLDPSEAGLFIHEAFGHLSEADGLQNNPSFRARLRIGEPIATPILNVTDDPTRPDLPGSYEIDDEGVMGTPTRLITDGVLSGRLHSRETAAAFGEPLSGNMRAVDALYTPIVRMSNIFIEPGTHSFDEMVGSIDHGYYLVGAKGGQTSGDQFTFGAQWGFRIEQGRLGPMVRDINMSGELFSTLQQISMISEDLSFSERGGCGKGSPQQLNRKSGKGAPHIKIDRVTLGGVR